ncbi:transposable element Tc1 transposase [Trichonephila clavipes]|uniref:Transposable element Tc1 transposase n=1 Tax=Trichonephila clavipes TaxID=2585209 RepID=A0A8X6VPC9_TRICX|nr:transposable element Tc1 transposase [Trichonephila clavipes]
MITNIFIPELNNHDVQELWFQQDGATCHTARATIDLLKDTFGDHLISRFGPVNWPPRSCDLIPLDYFLWGYVKSLVYADKPQTLDHLEDNIRRVIADIWPQMLEKVIENWTSRLDYIRASRGSPMPEIIFKINCWKQGTREGTHVRKTGSGATRKSTRREDRRIVRQALVDLTVTRSTIRADVGVAIVPQTILRHLAEANLKSKRPFHALPLTSGHRQLRLQWCLARSMWNVTDWQKVVFSDKSRFVLGTDDNRVLVWRCPAYDSRSTLIVMRGILTGQRYVDDILRPHTLPWPSHSPNLSPVEHVWDQLKRQMPSCHSVHDLQLGVQDLWAHLPQDNIRCLINSMPDCVAACIAAGGGPTRY